MAAWTISAVQFCLATAPYQQSALEPRAQGCVIIGQEPVIVAIVSQAGFGSDRSSDGRHGLWLLEPEDKGARWKILGLFLVLLVVYWLLSIVVGLVGIEDYGAEGDPEMSVTNLIGSVLLGTIFNAVWGTIQPSLYVELRHWKEGDSTDVLEQVFA